MTFRLLILALCLPFVIAAALASEIIVPVKRTLDVSRLIDCIAQIEGGKPNALGGRCCIGAGAWYDRTVISYANSRFPEQAEPIYALHLRWIMESLEAQGIRPTPAICGECWRYGLQHYLDTRRASDYGRRVANLYGTLETACTP